MACFLAKMFLITQVYSRILSKYFKPKLKLHICTLILLASDFYRIDDFQVPIWILIKMRIIISVFKHAIHCFKINNRMYFCVSSEYKSNFRLEM